MSKPAVTVEATAMAPEPMAAAMKSSEEAGVVDEEIDGVGIVSRAEERGVASVVRLRVAAIAVVVIVGVAVVGAVGI
jgi:hypothetical protein